MSPRKTLGINPLDAIIPPKSARRTPEPGEERANTRREDSDSGHDAVATPTALETETQRPMRVETSEVEEAEQVKTEVNSQPPRNEGGPPPVRRKRAILRAPSNEQSARQTVVEVEQLILKDKTGTARAALGCSEDGRVLLSLCDSQGNPRLEMQVSDSGRARVVMRDAEQEIRALLGIDETGKPSLVLGDRDQKPRIALGVLENRDCFLRLFHEDGHTPFAGLP